MLQNKDPEWRCNVGNVVELYHLAHNALEIGMCDVGRRMFGECLGLFRRMHGGIDYHVDVAVTLQGLVGALLGSGENEMSKSVFVIPWVC